MVMITNRKYWSEGWSGLDVGHRGLGNSYTQVVVVIFSVVVGHRAIVILIVVLN